MTPSLSAQRPGSPGPSSSPTWLSHFSLLGSAFVFAGLLFVAQLPRMEEPPPQPSLLGPSGEVDTGTADGGAALARSSSADETQPDEAASLVAASGDTKPVEGGDDLSEFDRRLWAMVDDDGIVAEGKSAYEAYCLACHGTEETASDPALVGSRSHLFDDTWFHGSNPADIVRIIREGYAPGGMMGWEGLAPDPEIEAMTAYLLAFQERPDALD